MTDFEAATKPLQHELTTHCYRLLGSWDEAEDAVQEVQLRAWRGWDKFEQRSSARTWLYRIATNVCLTVLNSHGRRALPTGLSATDLDQPGSLSPETWVQPYADNRDDVRLALVAGLQTLPPTQRTVLLLREVLSFPATEVAAMLDTSVAAVKSSLQRARARLAAAAPRPDDIVEPTSPQGRQFLDAYVTAFQSANIDILTAVLRADARLEIVPYSGWFDGIAACAPVFRAAAGEPGDWRMEPTIANGQPAARAYQYGQPYGITVLDVRQDGIAGVTVFHDPALIQRFGSKCRAHL